MATATVKLLEEIKSLLTTKVARLEKGLEELREANKVSVSELKDELARERSIWEEKEKKMAARLDKAEKMLVQQRDEAKKLWQAIYEASRRSTTTGADGAIVGVSAEATEIKLSNNGGPLTGFGTFRLSCMKSLKKLDICRILDESAFTHLYTMTWLEELTLRTGTGTFSSTMAQGVGNWTVLTRLDLIDCKISDAGLAQLTGLGSLQTLVLSRTQNQYIDPSSIPSSAGMVHVAKLKRLISLDISASLVREDGLRHLSSLEKLTWLSLPSKVSARGLQHLKCLSLKTILFRSSLDRYGVEHLKAIPSLEKVGLSDTYDVNIVKRALPDINVFQLLDWSI